MIELDDIVIDEIVQFEKDLTFVRDFLDRLPKEVEYLTKLAEKKQREQEDLLHYMEFNRLSANKGYDAYDKMYEVRNERRKAKDMLEVMKCANDKLKPKLPNISVFSNALGDVRGIISKHKTRKYKPRELHSLNYGNKALQNT